MRTESPSLTDPQLASWRGFLRSHAAITQELDADLVAAHGLSLSEYEVLLHLAQAPDRQLRLVRLSEQVLLTRSGITRLVTRLEVRGLVERVCCPSDRRGYNARLTGAGYQKLRAASPTHLDGIRRLFVEPLGADVERVGDVLGRLGGACALSEPVRPGRTAA